MTEHTESRRTDEPTDFRAEVPSDAEQHVCERCGRPFVRERYLVLHRGLDHPADLNESELDAFREAYEAEEADIRRFRIVALGTLVLLYFGLLFAYAVFA